MSSGPLIALPVNRNRADLGGKARQLQTLIQQDFSVPRTWVCPQGVFQRYLAGDPSLLEELIDEFRRTLHPERSYAVRSSANLEDGSEVSFAGQFSTLLDVQGYDALIAAVEAIWNSARSPQMQSYLDASRLHTSQVEMAVIIQEMVPPVVSGVSFSINPVTGMDEILIEAVQGSGEKLVQSGVTPQKWVYKWGAWIEEPEEGLIDPQILLEIASRTRHLADEYAKPVDLEWVYDGQSLHWVQLREVTALEIPIYSNHISREVFPGLIKPLIWSVNVPLVNEAWVRLFTELIGPNEIDPRSLAEKFYARAYFNMGTIGRIFELLGFPRESLELLMGLDIGGPEKPSFRPGPKTFALLPRMVLFAIGKLGFGRRVSRVLPELEDQFRRWKDLPLQNYSCQQLLDYIDRLYDQVQETAYYNIVTPLLMQASHQVFRGRLRNLGVDPQTVNVTAGMDAYQRYEPSAHIAELQKHYRKLSPDQQDWLEEYGLSGGEDQPEITHLGNRIEDFLEQFGHLSDSGNDFSAVPWRENPDLVLKMIQHHQPQQERGAGMAFSDLALKPWTRLFLTPLYRMARRFQYLREAVGSTYTFGYGLFREAFLTLGEKFQQRHLLDTPEEIFFLKWEEIRELCPSDQAAGWRDKIKKRKQELEQYREITPPGIIYGDEAPPVTEKNQRVLLGTPTSRGCYTGPVRVARGIDDLERVQAGDVLVIPYSDVGWTPLFSRAGAVVAESGGILSHSSIIAREYGIPAVVAVPGACGLADNTWVTVDGYRGEVILNQDPNRNPQSFSTAKE